MKLQRRFFLFSGTIILLIVGMVIYDNYHRNRLQVAYRNEANVGSIKTGMNELQMMKIMGNPSSIYLSYMHEKTFCYTSNKMGFRDIEICIDTNNVVSKVLVPGK